MSPVRLVILGCWFMTREIEQAAANLHDVTFDPENRTISSRVPASKTDMTAKGVTRTHGCGCTAARVSAICPYHNMLA